MQIPQFLLISCYSGGITIVTKPTTLSDAVPRLWHAEKTPPSADGWNPQNGHGKTRESPRCSQPFSKRTPEIWIVRRSDLIGIKDE